jgi:hypothetical protein
MNFDQKYWRFVIPALLVVRIVSGSQRLFAQRAVCGAPLSRWIRDQRELRGPV